MNNLIINRFLIWLGKDNIIKKYKANWSITKIDKSKTLQENVGFSNQKDIQLAIEKVHDKLQLTFRSECSAKGSVLDIGCGVGLYLKDFPEEISVVGTDLSPDFIDEAKNLLPNGQFFAEDYMNVRFEKKFKMVFSISVLEYISPSNLPAFFKKINQDLENDGIVFIQYPHALNNKACWYPDLSYIHYSPIVVENAIISAGFEVLSHSHSFDDRELNFKFDKKRYDPENENSFKNGAIIVARKNG